MIISYSCSKPLWLRISDYKRIQPVETCPVHSKAENLKRFLRH
jgi:hypothetical protein